MGNDGTVFYFYPEEQGAPVLMKQSPGAQPVEVVLPEGFSISRIGAAPSNGQWLVIAGAVDEGSLLFVLPLAGGEPVALGDLSGIVGSDCVETENNEWMLLATWADELDTLVALRTRDMHIEPLAAGA